MKILIVINSLTYGGAEKQAIVDANSLNKKGHKVTVAFNLQGELVDLLDEGVNLYKISNKNEILASFQLLFHLIVERYDLIHAHMFWAEKVTAIPSWITRTKLILNEHGLGKWRKWYHILVMKFISVIAYKIANSSDATKRIRLEKEKLPEKKLVTLYNSYQLNRSEENEESIDLRQNKKFNIGFVGRFATVKRLNLFIYLAEELRVSINDFRIILVGDGKNKNELEASVNRKKLSNYFYFPGYVQYPENYYKIFDVFFLPSKREALSIALLEAGASGIPAIAFDVGGNSEIILDQKTGYIIPEKNMDLVVNRIMTLYEKPERKKEMGSFAEEHIKKKFSVESRINRLETIYYSKQ